MKDLTASDWYRLIKCYQYDMQYYTIGGYKFNLDAEQAKRLLKVNFIKESNYGSISSNGEKWYRLSKIGKEYIKNNIKNVG